MELMNKTARWFLLVLALAGFTPSNTIQASRNDETAVREAVARFYVAVNTMFRGDIMPMKPVWSHAEDVTYMGPMGGFEVGWNQVLANWEQQTKMKLGGKVRPEGIRIAVGEHISVVQNYEKGENINVEGHRKLVSIRATNVFRKENGDWKMIGHHTDLLPFLDK